MIRVTKIIPAHLISIEDDDGEEDGKGDHDDHLAHLIIMLIR